MILANEDSKYLAALYGGREITRALNVQREAVLAHLADVDEYIGVTAGFSYNAATGEMRVVRDDKEVEIWTIASPMDGYWSAEGFRVRRIGETALMFRSAEAMFDWPIYRAAVGGSKLPDRVEVSMRCLCDCSCHGGGYCLDTIEDGKRDCDHDCRGTGSSVVCEPFIERIA